MKLLLNIISLVFLTHLLVAMPAWSQQTYFPPRGEWAEKTPAEVGVDPRKINRVIDFALEHALDAPEDPRAMIALSFASEPYHQTRGPTRKRGTPAGMIIKNGYVIGKWGDTRRVDMTFSVAKSYLSTVAGLAVDDGLITDLNHRVADYVWDGTFDGDHNSKITWHHLLNQSSDWYGTLFGMSDWADRPPEDGGVDDWRYRELREPGTTFEYNDVRINVLAYALLQVIRQPIPAFFNKRIMVPIGASTTWRWYGYDNSWVEIDGTKVQSVSGGGHYGGGIFISTEDHARFGYLFLRDGNWDGRQLISKQWIDKVRKPSAANESYGYLWWLNKGKEKAEGVSEDVYFAAGAGGNYIIIDQEHDLLVVTRWLDQSKRKEFIKLAIDAVK